MELAFKSILDRFAFSPALLAAMYCDTRQIPERVIGIRSKCGICTPIDYEYDIGIRLDAQRVSNPKTQVLAKGEVFERSL